MAKKGKIVAFPTLRAIPAPDIPLTGHAYNKYVELANKCLDAGRLNVKTLGICQDLAILHGDYYTRTARQQSVPIRNIELRTKLMQELDFGDERNTVGAERPASENRFSKFGVITRTWAA